MKTLSQVHIITLLFLFSNFSVAQEFRTIDGSDNNENFPSWGSSGDVLYQLTTPSFGDGISTLSGRSRMNPRQISNFLFDQSEMIFDRQNLSDFVWVFGQFIDHDIIFVDNEISEPLFIDIPLDDASFDPEGPPILMFRSKAVEGTGSDTENVRQFSNDITAFIDGSSVYGSTSSRAKWLRTYEDGKLKTSRGNLLPWNTLSGEFNDVRDPSSPHMDDPIGSSSRLFVAGDVRANENPLLLTLHTIFVREHNRLCDEIKSEFPDWEDEQIYQRARKLVGANIQSITYNEWLPSMGINLPEYSGYRSDVNPQISNVFSAAAFRMGHTLINSNVIRMTDEGATISNGNISLRDAFFNPLAISLAGGIEPYLRGMASQPQQQLDCKMVDDIRNFLFGSPSAGGLDLAAININRGRERGLSDFNKVRSAIGLPVFKTFEEISSNVEDVEALKKIYANIDDMDVWVGMLAEEFMPDAMFGRTIKVVLEDQFRRLRDGDKYYFENDSYFTQAEIEDVVQTSLRDIIMRNTDISLMQSDVFKAVNPNDIDEGPDIEQSDFTLLAYPNPTFSDFAIKIHSSIKDDADISIYDNRGRLFSNQTVRLEEGDNTIPLSLSSAPGGLYYNVAIARNFHFKVIRVFKP